MNKYPYYIMARFDAGILKKVFNDKKFSSREDLINLFEKWYKRHENFNKDRQFLEIKYVNQYEAYIVNIWENGKIISINQTA